MRTSRWTLLTITLVAVFAASLVFQPASLAGEEGAVDAKTLFVETHKCQMCHGVPAAGIEAKMKSEKMKGPDLGGKSEIDFEKLAAYLRKEAELDGEEHNKEFKGTDEELQAIVDWLGTLEAPAAE